MIFIIIQPIYDAFIYFLNFHNINIPIIPFIRPFIAITIYIYLLFNNKVSCKEKVISLSYLIIYGVYSVLHLINIKDQFFSLSYGNLSGEFRYLCNYGYFILQLINFYLILKILDKEEKKKLLKSFIVATCILAILYFISVLTKTSPITYPYSSASKYGWKGWSVSSHYIGHSIIYSLPCIIYLIFEKKYIIKWYKYLIILLLIVPPFYLIGTKAPFFATFGIIVFYTIMKIIIAIKSKKINTDTIFFIILALVLNLTFTSTFGYSNFNSQIENIGTDNKEQINNFNPDKVDISNIDSSDQINNKNPILNSTKNNKMILAIYRYETLSSEVFDNRIIQKITNKYLRSISSTTDKMLGYGHDTMPQGIWVETDFHSIYYCYGTIGLILIIIIPYLFIAINGLKCLINIKQMSVSKFLLGAGFGLSFFILFFVGYTLQFAQTVFYLVMLLVIANNVFKEKQELPKKDYLFAINDLNIGGAEVGMVDVVNELVKQGKKVDIVLLRKEGPLLEKLDARITVYEILNKNYNSLKRKMYHTLYMLGGPFIKYVYKKTIKREYLAEIAYIEGYPAVFISSSNNTKSVKIASIRVGLKNHKLKASKIPWGEYEVKKAYKKIDNIYTVSDLTTKEFLEKYPFCQNKTHTIYTYFNVEDIRAKANEDCLYKFDKTKINFIAVGRCNAQKSYDRLISAFKEITKKNNNCLLHILGTFETTEGKKIINQIKEYNLEKKVILHGVIKNPYPYIKNSDCLISSSLYEGFPRVVNEAISLGKLCIGTNVTGTKEALHNGDLGLLVDDSIDGLIEGMQKYINNPEIYNNYKDKMANYDGNKETYFRSLEELTHKRENMIIYMPKLSYGGMEKSLINLINYAKLNEKYNLTLYLVYKGDMNYIDLLPKNIKLIIACPNKWNLVGKFAATIKLSLRFIYQIFKNYDIAISYSYQHSILTTLARLSSENNIVYIHGNLKKGIEPKLLKKRLKKCKYEKFNKVICVSEDAKIAFTDLTKRQEKIYAINNLIDGNVILEKSKEEIDDFKFKKNKTYFINICRHDDQYKKLCRIISATKKLNDEGYDFEVLFIGDGKDHELYVNKIKELNINNIHLLGKKENPYKYLKHSTAFVLSSIREGYPVVFIEAMILNKPIITTNVSDAKKDIEGKFGIVVDNNDSSVYKGMKKFLEKGFKIKECFKYEEFNKDLIIKTFKVYNEK